MPALAHSGSSVAAVGAAKVLVGSVAAAVAAAAVAINCRRVNENRTSLNRAAAADEPQYTPWDRPQGLRACDLILLQLPGGPGLAFENWGYADESHFISTNLFGMFSSSPPTKTSS